AIFKREEDYVVYLKILYKAKRKHCILLYSYCLMLNHIHLLIEVPSSSNMSKFMQWLNKGYSEYFNRTYNVSGHLWQGRFISKPILKDQYLLHCANYIESNPVRAKIVDKITEYKWSSYIERCILSKSFMIDDIGDTLVGKM
ncbi:MAG: transposase, partial [Candidatus Omnitrophota bacterium]